MKKIIALYFLFIVLFNPEINSQISEGGIPPGFSKQSNLKSALQSEFVNAPDLAKLESEDKANDAAGKPYRISQMIDVDYSIFQNGKWDTLSSGEIIWRLKIYSPGASGLRLLYSNFYLPVGTKLFLYSENEKFVIGAFTSKNNHPSGQFATEIIPGEACILEYVTSRYVIEKPRLTIDQIGFIYRGMEIVNPSRYSTKASESCEVNVNCSPEGDNWRDVKRSVVHLLLGNYVCSGTLVNNTAGDFKSYLATAFHCIEGIESSALTWVFYFNYEKTTCSNNPSTQYKTLTGAYIRAKTPINGGGDGALLELKDLVPDLYNAYWSGWDCSETPMSGGVCIHHPAGDYKKISTIRTDWYSTTWQSADAIGAAGQHWNLVFSKTQNGYGIIEGGSSGSGLFGPDELLRGTLSGADTDLSCDQPGLNSLFGKLSYNWDKYSSDSSMQYKYWLDPGKTGKKRILGMDKNTNSGFHVYWTSSIPVRTVDSVIRFKDETVGVNLTRTWYFEGGTPATSTEIEPAILYSESGIYDVTLEVVKDGVTYKKTRTDYCVINPRPVWALQNSGFSGPGYGIEGIEIVDSLTVWAWAIDLLNVNKLSRAYTRTTDGGVHWKANTINLPGLESYEISNLFPVNKDTAYAALFDTSLTVGGKIIRTSDGGQTWQVQSSVLFSPPDGFPNLVYFFNKNEGVAIGDPNTTHFEIYTTSNGGDVWNRVSSSNIPVFLTGEYGTTNFYDAVGDTIWFGTTSGRVYRSVNKGSNWTVYKTGLKGRINVRFQNALVGFAIQSKVGNYPFAIKQTFDGGVNWSNYNLPQNFLQGELAYVPGTSNAWVSVASGNSAGTSYSINGGQSFTILDEGVPYTSLKFLNAKFGWAGSYTTDSITGGIYKWNSPDCFRKTIVIDSVVSPYVVNLYPNPVFDNMNLNIQSTTNILEACTITITNTQGSIIKSLFIEQLNKQLPVSINVADLPSGIYCVHISGISSNFNGKFIKF